MAHPDAHRPGTARSRRPPDTDRRGWRSALTTPAGFAPSWSSCWTSRDRGALPGRASRLGGEYEERVVKWVAGRGGKSSAAKSAIPPESSSTLAVDLNRNRVGIECKGGEPDHRGGLLRSDNIWKVLGQTLTLHNWNRANPHDPIRFLVVTVASPPTANRSPNRYASPKPKATLRRGRPVTCQVSNSTRPTTTRRNRDHHRACPGRQLRLRPETVELRPLRPRGPPGAVQQNRRPASVRKMRQRRSFPPAGTSTPRRTQRPLLPTLHARRSHRLHPRRFRADRRRPGAWLRRLGRADRGPCGRQPEYLVNDTPCCKAHLRQQVGAELARRDDAGLTPAVLVTYADPSAAPGA